MESTLATSFKAFHSRLRARLINESEFGNEISNFLVDLERFGLRLKVAVKENETVFAEYGTMGIGDACKSKAINESPVTILLTGWSSTGSTTQETTQAEITWDEYFDDISRIFSEHWRCRQAPSGLWSGSDSSVAAKRQETVKSAAIECLPAAYVRLDCDGVGEVKQSLGGEEKTTEVLRAVARYFHKELARQCLTFHLHGDEFALIYLGLSRRKVLEQLVRFQTDFCKQDFRPSGHTEAIHLGVKMAVSFLGNECGKEAAESAYANILAAADNVEFKNREDRGFIEIAQSSTPAVGPISRQVIQESVLWARQGLVTNPTFIFKNDLHDLIADILVQHPDETSVSECLKELEKRFVLRIFLANDDCALLSTAKQTANRDVPLTRLAALMLHVILKRRFSGFGPASETGKLRVVISKTSSNTPQTLAIQQLQATKWKTLFSYGPIHVCDPVSVEAGEPWLPSETDPDGTKQFLTRWIPEHPGPHSLSPCLAILAGAAAVNLEPSVTLWTAAVVHIDDRPVISGHLPDFWQSNIARIVVECLRNPNIRDILLVRENHDTVKETLRYLAGACTRITSALPQLDSRESWDNDRIGAISDATTIKYSQLVHFRDRKIWLHVIESKADVVSQVAFESYQADVQHLKVVGDSESITWNKEKPKSRPGPKVEFRQAKLKDAYPQVLRALRHEACARYLDPHGEELAELTSVHVHLENPSVDDYPAYWEKAQPSFNQYYQGAFTPSSLFGQRFYNWGGKGEEKGIDQFEAAVRETIAAINGNHPTRRIILATPQPKLQPTESDKTDPLGLTSVHIFPRYREATKTLLINFIWVWRSVEAIVGFPFSAHGSVRFSNEFVNTVKLRMGNQDPNIRMGELTYIAISMHLYCDPADLAIARHIDLEARP